MLPDAPNDPLIIISIIAVNIMSTMTLRFNVMNAKKANIPVLLDAQTWLKIELLKI